MPKKILVISHDKVGPSMAGPGIRYHRIASNLAKKHDVTLAVFNPSYIENIDKTPYRAIDIHVQKFQEEFGKYDAIIALWLSDEMIEYAKSKNIVLIFDLYAPVPVEDLVQRVFGGNVSPESDYDYSQMLRNYRHFVKNGDFLMTSNMQQQDFWMGYAFGGGKTSPSLQNTRGIDTYFGVCPMGISLEEIAHMKNQDLLSPRIKGIKKDDYVVVWTGGIWDWFDGKTPIDAIDKVVKSGNTKVKFVFLGTKHPNDDVPAMAETEVARDRARKLGLLDKYVFFLDGWLPYADRIYYLNRADAALYAHKPSIESRFSHRTRVLDHILMSLPTIATKGDYFSDYINNHHLGISVEPFDAAAMADAIKTLANDKKLEETIIANIKKSQPVFTWDYTLQPLNDYIDSQFFVPSPLSRRTSTTPTETIVSSRAVRVAKRIVPHKVKSVIKRVIR
jgi:glycosyltransferase involved in cell wall biosynthesis